MPVKRDCVCSFDTVNTYCMLLHTHPFQSGLTALDVARAKSHQAVCEVIEKHLQQSCGQEESDSQDQIGENEQVSRTELTEVGNCRLKYGCVVLSNMFWSTGTKVRGQICQ